MAHSLLTYTNMKSEHHWDDMPVIDSRFEFMHMEIIGLIDNRKDSKRNETKIEKEVQRGLRS